MIRPQSAISERPRKRTQGGVAISLACACTLWLTGCALLAPRPIPWNYYLLTSLPGGDPGAQPANPALAVGLGPITLPTYLDRIQVVRRESPNKLAFSDRDRWGQPLDEGFTRVLADDLVILLGSKAVFRSPWRVRDTLDYIVEIDVTRFEIVAASRRAELRARWRIRDPRTRALVDDSASELERPLADESTAAGVTAMSDVVADLARELTAALAGVRAGTGSAHGGAPGGS